METRASGLDHCVYLYSSADTFLGGAVPFLEAGLVRGDAMLVLTGPGNIEVLRSALGREVRSIEFGDLTTLGGNPGRIISLWDRFLSRRDGRRARGIGEPVWGGRDPDSLEECYRHEALVNLAFSNGPSWDLLCPYNTEELAGEVIDHALRSHPLLAMSEAMEQNSSFEDPREADHLGGPPLVEPELAPREMDFGRGDLGAVRAFVRSQAAAAGLDGERTSDLILAANEIATNSVLFGGGSGHLRAWSDADRVTVEVSDAGRITDPLVGRIKPAPDQPHGRGIWLANQVCDLVQLRSRDDSGTVVRLHMMLAA